MSAPATTKLVPQTGAVTVLAAKVIVDRPGFYTSARILSSQSVDHIPKRLFFAIEFDRSEHKNTVISISQNYISGKPIADAFIEVGPQAQLGTMSIVERLDADNPLPRHLYSISGFRDGYDKIIEPSKTPLQTLNSTLQTSLWECNQEIINGGIDDIYKVKTMELIQKLLLVTSAALDQTNSERPSGARDIDSTPIEGKGLLRGHDLVRLAFPSAKS